MPLYKLTVFENSGKKLLDEGFEAANDGEAKTKGQELLHKHAYENYTYRCTSSLGQLLLFHV
ncbi:YhzD family protein [Bacillus xiapuensis]|uniref:YhzD family protein n=1 Tax=Bacillus xiapuensis TaxID=2014075 RepID=UPI0018E2411F|nr:YhzD family protein [Bacillus xiapuensis]